jgi:hypothetical protein
VDEVEIERRGLNMSKMVGKKENEAKIRSRIEIARWKGNSPTT